ncbi:AraC family transcriptional regulator [Dyella sp.]|uniref:AraC family transcriptional regulator n=1 Tax=Dyella sp. TaxID=1869338 RepID=UPI002ED50BB8
MERNRNKSTPVPTTSAAWVQSTLNALRQLGIDVDTLAKNAGIERDMLKNPASRWHTDKLSHLWMLASEHLYPSWMARIYSREVEPIQYGVIGYVMLSSPDALTGFRRLVDYLALISNASILKLHEEGRFFRLESELIGKHLPIPRQRYEYNLLTLFKMGKWLYGDAFAPIEVTTRFGKPTYVEDFHAVFRCPIHFDHSYNSILYSKDAFKMHPRLPMPEMAGVHIKIADHMLRQSFAGYFPMDVETAIEACISRGFISRDRVAADLLLSERTFKRRLNAHQIRYTEVVDQVRRRMALHLLADTQLSLSEIGERLAYSDPSTFTRAFTRWMGVPPSTFRSGSSGGPLDIE